MKQPKYTIEESRKHLTYMEPCYAKDHFESLLDHINNLLELVNELSSGPEAGEERKFMEQAYKNIINGLNNRVTELEKDLGDQIHAKTVNTEFYVGRIKELEAKITCLMDYRQVAAGIEPELLKELIEKGYRPKIDSSSGPITPEAKEALLPENVVNQLCSIESKINDLSDVMVAYFNPDGSPVSAQAKSYTPGVNDYAAKEKNVDGPAPFGERQDFKSYKEDNKFRQSDTVYINEIKGGAKTPALYVMPWGKNHLVEVDGGPYVYHESCLSKYKY